MDCQEAQALIQPFVSGELPSATLKQYIRHIESCPSCKEDLEIHYMIEVGLSLLDEAPVGTESTNLAQALQNILDATKDYLEFRHTLTLMRRSCVAAATAALVVCAMMAWGIL